MRSLDDARPRPQVDILMGTFTKSFGAMGGYVASSREFVDHVRSTSAGGWVGGWVTVTVTTSCSFLGERLSDRSIDLPSLPCAATHPLS